MGVNKNNQPVIKKWAWKLSWKQQAVILSALRGCDTLDKNDISKEFCRRLRNCILENGAVEGAEFMRSNISDEDVYKFTKSIDKYPIHFLLHLIHAAEVIGYNHPDTEEKLFWQNFYLTMVSAFHMKPETKEENDERLKDGVETCCHKT